MIDPSIGSHFIIGLSGPELSDLDRSVLSELRPLGVILRAHNFFSDMPYPDWAKALREMLSQVRVLCARNTPLVTIDHEGGRVHRTPPPLTHFPAAAVYADRASEVAAVMAAELASIGVNVSFAPVADIHSNRSNTVIGARAFGSEAPQVASSACAFAAALAQHGIAPVGKHFPGHGDTAQDSHFELPALDISVQALEARELVPFRALIASAIPALLVSHVLYPSLDSEMPASLSAAITCNLLRGKLGFGGVVMSDDLDMKAISENFGDEEVALRSLQATVDILLFNHDPQRALRVARFASHFAKHGDVSPEAIAASKSRINHFLKTHVRQHEVTEHSLPWFESHHAFARTLN